MKTIKNNQSGIAHLAAILLIVLVVAIGGIGWYVWNNNKTKEVATNVSNTNTTPAPVTPKKTEVQDKTANWLTYKAPGYTIKFADGWTIMKKEASNDSFAVTDNDDLKYVADTKAIVKDYVRTGPGEFTYGFAMDYAADAEKCTDTSLYPKYKLKFKTNGNNAVYNENIISDGNAPFLPNKGDKSYQYCVQLSDKSSLHLGYTLEVGKANYSSTIEDVIKTIKAN